MGSEDAAVRSSDEGGELVDRRLLEHEQIICSAGDHRHAVSFPPGALLELMDPIVADICET